MFVSAWVPLQQKHPASALLAHEHLPAVEQIEAGGKCQPSAAAALIERASECIGQADIESVRSQNVYPSAPCTIRQGRRSDDRSDAGQTRLYRWREDALALVIDNGDLIAMHGVATIGIAIRGFGQRC